MSVELPEQGLSHNEVFERITELKAEDADWRGGRTWSLIYPAGDDVDRVIEQAAEMYLFENALNPFKFPSLRRMEAEVVEMTAGLLNSPPGAGGSMTSGGTESILMAVKTARDRAHNERGVNEPTLVAPYSAHPAFAKAAHYFGLEQKQIPLADDLRADLKAVDSLIDDNTALVVGSAPGYPHGVMDPIEELASLAAARGVLFHTDSCLGGFLLPFYERIGLDVPPFDFRVDGVTSMSADVHKYGYAPKGASVVLHREGSSLQIQAFMYADWPGGLYGSFAMAGARPALPIAASWAVMNYLGVEGYTRLARVIHHATTKIKDAVDAIEGLHLLGEPVMSVLAIGSSSKDIMAIGDEMDARGWHLDRQTDPSALHLMVTPNHSKVVDQFISDLEEANQVAGDAKITEARYS